MSGDISNKNKNRDEGQIGQLGNHGSATAGAAQVIEENLKRVYQASLTEPVPDRFVQLLALLREKEGKS